MEKDLLSVFGIWKHLQSARPQTRTFTPQCTNAYYSDQPHQKKSHKGGTNMNDITPKQAGPLLPAAQAPFTPIQAKLLSPTG